MVVMILPHFLVYCNPWFSNDSKTNKNVFVSEVTLYSFILQLGIILIIVCKHNKFLEQYLFLLSDTSPELSEQWQSLPLKTIPVRVAGCQSKANLWLRTPASGITRVYNIGTLVRSQPNMNTPFLNNIPSLPQICGWRLATRSHPGGYSTSAIVHVY